MAGQTSRRNGAKSRNGPHSRVTQAAWQAYCDHVRLGDTKAVAAHKIGIPARTLRYHAQHKAEPRALLQEAERESIDWIQQQLVEIAMGRVDKATMVRFYATVALLRKRDPEGGWRESREFDKEPGAGESTQLDFSKLSDTELEHAVDALARAVAERGETPLGVLPR